MTSLSLRPVAWAVLDYWKARYTTLLLVVGVAVTAALGVALSGQAEQAQTVLVAVTVYAPIVAGLLTMSGIVSDDRESGLILMWFQKPARLFRTYALRYAIYQTVLLMLGTVLGLVVAAVSIAGDLPILDHPLRWVFPIWTFSTVTAAMVFALSAWGARRDSALALLIIIGSFTLGARTVFDYSLRAEVIRTLAFPLDAATILSGSRNHMTLQHATLIVLGHCVGWTLLGLLGLRYTERALTRGS